MERQIVDADVPRCANVRHVKKPIDEKTPLAAWATLARAEAGMSVEETIDALAARGHGGKAATIRGIEGGSKGASARLLRFLAAVYGAVPPVQAGPDVSVGDSSSIVSAIDRLREAVEAQTRQLESLAESAGSGLADLVLRLVEDQSRARDGSAGQHQGAGR